MLLAEYPTSHFDSAVRGISSAYCCHRQGHRQGQPSSKHIYKAQTLLCVSKSHKSAHRPCRPALKASVRGPKSAKLDMASMSDADEVAIVLVDHGSKRAEANAMLEDFADLYRSAAGLLKFMVEKFRTSHCQMDRLCRSLT